VLIFCTKSHVQSTQNCINDFQFCGTTCTATVVDNTSSFIFDTGGVAQREKSRSGSCPNDSMELQRTFDPVGIIFEQEDSKGRTYSAFQII
jgi:hypothetical protein